MKNTMLNQEIRYAIYGKSFFALTLALILLFTGMVWLNATAIHDLYHDFRKTELFYEEAEIDMLEGEYAVEIEEDGSIVVENPLLFYRENVKDHLLASHPSGLLRYLLTTSIVLFPLVFGTLGLLFATSDFKYRVIKLKAVRSNKVHFLIQKYLALFCISLCIYIASLVVSYLVGLIVWKQVVTQVPVHEFLGSELLFQTKMIREIIVSFSLAIYYAIIGYGLGALFRHNLVGVLCLIVYQFILPVLNINLREDWLRLYSSFLDFHGAISIDTPTPGSIVGSVLVLMIVSVVVIGVTSFLITKRSSFVS